MDAIRLIFDPPASGAWNMAVDEALLDAAAGGLWTLRFYEWIEPTLSLGYFQATADRRLHPASASCPLVRRASGGGAIVHDRELTYSFAAPQHGRFAAEEVYDLLHGVLVQSLAEWGVGAELCRTPSASGVLSPPRAASEPFLCFQRRTAGDVLCKGEKIAGSAQRRRRAGLLQHGSVLLARSVAAPQLDGLAEVAATVLEPAELAACWQGKIAQRTGWQFVAGSLAESEVAAASRYVAEKFSAPTWNCRR